MPDSTRPRRSPARFLAPLALVATIVGTVLVVLHHTDATRKTPAPTQTQTRDQHATSGTGTGTVKRPSIPPVKGYTVRSGDTLSLIAARTGVSLATLEALNPAVSSNSLHVGQRIVLRR